VIMKNKQSRIGIILIVLVVIGTLLPLAVSGFITWKLNQALDKMWEDVQITPTPQPEATGTEWMLNLAPFMALLVVLGLAALYVYSVSTRAAKRRLRDQVWDIPTDQPIPAKIPDWLRQMAPPGTAGTRSRKRPRFSLSSLKVPGVVVDGSEQQNRLFVFLIAVIGMLLMLGVCFVIVLLRSQHWGGF
jgi:hypothetical protein